MLVPRVLLGRGAQRSGATCPVQERDATRRNQSEKMLRRFEKRLPHISMKKKVEHKKKSKVADENKGMRVDSYAQLNITSE